MDFVDLDKVLDEFEEEEKQALSIVPGQELKPSGYIEFLERHEDSDWNSLNPSKYPSYGGYTIERRSAREPTNVAYDDPYDSFSHNKLGFITDYQNESMSFNGYDRSIDVKKSNSEIVTNLTRVGSTNSENVNTVYPSAKAPDRRGIANSTERKGTIAYQPIEVQTDALSPASEHELMSSPFPKSDIIVDGHGDTTVLNEVKVESEQNHSPIYASMDTMNLVSNNNSLADEQPFNSAAVACEDQSTNTLGEIVNTTALPAGTEISSTLETSGGRSLEQIISFHDPVEDEDLEDCDVDMYLKDMDTDVLKNSDSTKAYSGSQTNVNTSELSLEASQVPDIQSDLNHSQESQTRSLAEELNDAEQTEDHYSLSYSQNMPKRFCADVAESDVVASHLQNPDIVADIGLYVPEEATLQHVETAEDQLPSSDTVRQSVFNSIMRGKMELEHILENCVKSNSLNCTVGENLLRGRFEIEKILNNISESVPSNKGKVFLETERLHFSSLNQPDVTQNSETSGHALSMDEKAQDSNSLSPASSLTSNSNDSLSMGLGARPKDPSLLKKSRPNSLLGLSKVTLDRPSVPVSVDEPSSGETCHQHHLDAQSPSYFPDVTISHQLNGEFDQTSYKENTDGNPIIHNFSSSPNGSSTENLSDSSQEHVSNSQKTKRPTSLNIRKPEFNMEQNYNGSDREDEPSPSSGEHNEAIAIPDSDELNSVSASAQAVEEEGTIDITSHSQTLSSNLGQQAPFWIPDSDAPECMLCRVKFTIWKRRHHCRACGKVLCSTCCSQKALLPYMENKEARVCVECHLQLTSGSHRRSGEPKQVMFSDGIRPGGDLTELDGPEQTRPRRSARGSRKQGPSQHQGSPPARKIKDDSLYRSPCLLPETGLPPIYMVTGDTGYVEHDESINQIDYTDDFKAEGGPFIYFAVNKNLSVGVKIVNLDCCVNRVCWFFVTRGMCTAGQSELIVLLELTEEEMNGSVSPPRDIFVHFHNVYEEALKGFTVQDMGHSICHSNFLGSRDHGGFLYLRPTFQCLSKLSLPEPPYLFGILLQKWEVPWAKVFPIRLMLRLGAEYRYYPCPLVGVRNRKPVFFEIGHTIINLLADFRNYQYMLSHIPGVTIKMEDKKTVINFPRNRYNEVMKVVRNSNEHVMALGSSFSSEADSHLVCIQNEDGSYQTQAINIQNKPRLETGASFVVFNGALKTSTGLRAKSSIVEDGLMVQVLPEAIVSIKEAMKEMTNYTIQCGPLESTSAEEIVELRWTENDKNFNFGVKSYIDGMSLEGVESVSVKSQSDFLGETLAIRWTRVYFLQHQESSSSHFDPLDLSRLTEDIAQACCTALVKHLDELKKEGQVKLGLRVNLTRDSVGYEIGSKGRSLPAAMINNLDTFLVPIVHQASEEGIVMELVFNIVD
ncbi:zinc finger FYVE domain-containing protein 9-like isoform X2 [Biomphalaria glabrata]|uniref:Zinc finger FYVE domain-containing protein 9-like isoform X2 n=1 Tax=Biomphalaria glabrata TaxID=6526 RepID=A0A9W3AI58_BIOGL|nr:zinc finger FYVE domain-containing protein 9-like isoform X2 [Biomphalaria glabrata]